VQFNQANDLTRTTFFNAVITGLVRDVFRAVLGNRLGWTLARVRVVIPQGQIDGRLPLHMEKNVSRYPDSHNVWVPVLADGKITNCDVPGIQFLVGKSNFLRNGPEEEVNAYLASLEDRQDATVLKIGDDAFLCRPQMRTGDLVIFSGHVPHGGHIPSRATSSKIACDFRIFPWTEVDYSNGNVNLRATPFSL
jgi:hypothetical protein